MEAIAKHLSEAGFVDVSAAAATHTEYDHDDCYGTTTSYPVATVAVSAAAIIPPADGRAQPC